MIRPGAALRDHPVIAEAGLPTAEAQLAVACAPDDVETEKLLVEMAETLPLRDFAKGAKLVRAHCDTGGFEPPAEPGRSEVTVAALGDGWVRLVATLAPQDAEVVACVDAQLHRALCRRPRGRRGLRRSPPPTQGAHRFGGPASHPPGCRRRRSVPRVWSITWRRRCGKYRVSTPFLAGSGWR
jgi:hypothetical protein